MPIRKRFSEAQTLLPLTEADVENVFSDAAEARANDDRGVFDPTHNALAGSYVERICGSDATPHELRATIGHLSFEASQRGQQYGPNDRTVHDLLAQARVMHNPGENVERTYRQRLRSPLSGIRGFCVHECKSGSPKAVSRCDRMSCTLWAFRMGKHGMRGKTG